MNLFIKASQIFAHDAHDSIGQRRKYGNNTPYWVHTDEVAKIVSFFTKDEKVIAAANLHDVEEDVHTSDYNIVTISLKFGGEVSKLVRELTDVYTLEAFPSLNRKRRKALEAIRLSTISDNAILIKLADLFSNTSSIVFHDPDFAVVYLTEKEHILHLLKTNNRINKQNRILFWAVKLQLKLARLYLKLLGK